MTQKPIPKNPTNRQVIQEIRTIAATVETHDGRIFDLETYNKNQELAKKAAKEAVDEYKQQEKDSQIVPAANSWLTKELISVIIKLLTVVTALIALGTIFLQTGNK